MIWLFNYSDAMGEATVDVDTDFAGCQRTRRSTSGGIIMMGAHPLRHWSTTQPTIALSSGEAELAGIVRGATQAIGFQSMARDLGFSVQLHIRTDATAAIGIVRRRGLGRIRHLDCSDLWVQDKLLRGAFRISQIAGPENVADILTKHVDSNTLHRLLPKMGIAEEIGRADSAPDLQH